MAQANAAYSLTNPVTGALVPGTVDGSGLSQAIGQGISTKLNVTTAQAIKVGAGRAVKIIFNVAGSAGTLTINDCATTGAATTANTIYSIAGGAGTALGTTILLDCPVTTGFVISAVPTGATLAVVYS